MKSQTAILGRMIAAGGNIYIGTDACTRKLTKVVAGASGATLTDIKVRGVSVKTERNYPDSLEAGDVLFAGDGEYFDYVKLSAGDAWGDVMEQDPALSSVSVAVADGYSGNASSIVITFSNAGGAGTKQVLFRYKDSEGTILDTDSADVYLLFGTSKSVTITDVFPSVAEEDDACTVEISFDNGYTWIASEALTITPVTVTLTSIAVEDATCGDELDITLTHTTSGNGTVELYYKITATDTIVLDSGTVSVPITEATGGTVAIEDITCPTIETEDTGVVFSLSLDGETWVDSTAFTVTPATVTLTSIAVEDATCGDELNITLTHTTAGNGTVDLYYKITATDTTVLDSGTVSVPITEATGGTVAIEDITCPTIETEDTGVVFSLSLDGETWVDSTAFTVTPAE